MIRKEDIKNGQFVMFGEQPGTIQKVNASQKTRWDGHKNIPIELSFSVVFLEDGSSLNNMFCPGEDLDKLTLITEHEADVYLAGIKTSQETLERHIADVENNVMNSSMC